jgi:MFS family permease
MVSINILLMAFQTNLGPRVEELGVGTLNTPFLISAYALALMTCNVLFGKLTDSIDGRYIFWLSATAMASNVVLMMGQPSLGRLFLACVMMGICEGALLPVVGVVLNRHFGTRSFGLVESLMLAMLIGIGMLGPVTMGMMRDLTGSYQLSLVVALALVAVASVIIKWLPNSGSSPRLVSTGH